MQKMSKCYGGLRGENVFKMSNYFLQELEQARATYDKFVADTLQPKETCLFRVICGDFNYDNTSPGEQSVCHLCQIRLFHVTGPTPLSIRLELALSSV